MNIDLLKTQRYYAHGVAQSAAEIVSRETGEAWEAVFSPRRHRDPQPFKIVKVKVK